MEKKIAIVLIDGLLNWQAMNAACHLCLSIGHYSENQIMGKHPVLDKTGVAHMGISKYPIVVLKAKNQESIQKLLHEVRQNSGLIFADFPREMLETYTDEQMVGAIAQLPESEIEYLGVAILGPADDLKRLTSKINLWG
jgi:hypothetical protein